MCLSFFETCQRVGLPNLTTRVEVFINVFSFFETWQRVGLPNLTTRVEVFMNVFSFFETSLRVGLPNLTTRVEVFVNPTISLLRHLLDFVSCDETSCMVRSCPTPFRCAPKDFCYFNPLEGRYGGLSRERGG
uniref:Uncharacterized protein n=1 Tax=Solanum tuberosum TaxID=4113 RepID=M1AEZ7_SOLTU